MPRLSPRLFRNPGDGRIFWFCPGCQDLHVFQIGEGPGPRWTWDGDAEAPTFVPSVKHTNGRGDCCHYVIRGGRAEFCSDSTHALAGQTVPMPNLPAWFAKGEFAGVDFDG